MTARFELKQVEQDMFEPWLAVVDAGKGKPRDLAKAVAAWTELLALRGTEKCSARQLAPLISWAEENEAQGLNGGLANERAWKQDE